MQELYDGKYENCILSVVDLRDPEAREFYMRSLEQGAGYVGFARLDELRRLLIFYPGGALRLA